LHNWSDKDCKKILENCKEAISGKGKRGKVIVIESVINEGQDEHGITGLKLLMDVKMSCLLMGKKEVKKNGGNCLWKQDSRATRYLL